ncbi:MAG TPA: RNA chaperone Hfq [Bryobacteraceae bacterium]|nr:RNA chaperone Hfq [Bryobacteraceae bacterium]
MVRRWAAARPTREFRSARNAPPKSVRRTSTAQHGKSARAPEATFEEAKYLKQLIEHETPVLVKMTDGEEVTGTIEYYDQSFIRLTREGEPNLFIFKHDIKYIQEM